MPSGYQSSSYYRSELQLSSHQNTWFSCLSKFLAFFLKLSSDRPENHQFFHETWWLFQILETTRNNDGSFILISLLPFYSGFHEGTNSFMTNNLELFQFLRTVIIYPKWVFWFFEPWLWILRTSLIPVRGLFLSLISSQHGYYLSFKTDISSPKILNCIAHLRVRFLMEKTNDSFSDKFETIIFSLFFQGVKLFR